MARQSRWLRFSVGSLLVAMSIVAGYLGGRRKGYDDGRDVWNHAIYVESYYVADLVRPAGDKTFDNVDFRPLISRLETLGTYSEWPRLCSVTGDPLMLTVVVATTETGHEQVQQTLEMLREKQP